MTGRPVVLGGTWNMLQSRPATPAAASALALMRTKRLAFLCVQECPARFAKALRAHAGDEFDVISFAGVVPGSDSESAIIVRADHDHGHGWQVKATRGGWITVRGGRTGPKYFTTVRFKDGLRIASIHAAPSVNWRGGVIFGPLRRVISMRQFARAVVKFARNHPGPLIIAGDWNATPEDRGRHSPHWIARKAGMHIAAPSKGTHGDTIDYALVRDCGATATREKRRGSDHFAVVFKVRP